MGRVKVSVIVNDEGHGEAENTDLSGFHEISRNKGLWQWWGMTARLLAWVNGVKMNPE